MTYLLSSTPLGLTRVEVKTTLFLESVFFRI